ncbi:MAG: permease [Bacteroidota bacterium]
MDSSLYKTLAFVCFILIGVLLKTKIKTKAERTGLKKIILNLALPSTIFIALMGVQIQWNLLFLPIMALALNLILFLVTPVFLPLLGFQKNTPEFKTAHLLIPSLAPGLSCFPFVLEFLGENALANVAMADLGNKIFVLVGLYIIAMNWHYRSMTLKQKGSDNVRSVLKALISEPVNVFIGVALVLLAFGFTMDSLPILLSDILEKLSLIMTPLVLLFIGLGLKIKRNQFFQIFSMLSIRAGVVFLLGWIFAILTGIQSTESVLLLLAFGLSACSFWPYAHISVVDRLEENEGKKTFNSDFALSLLALSFPFSTMLILGVLNAETVFSSSFNILFVGGSLILTGLVFPLVKLLRKRMVFQKVPKTKMESSTANHA